ncbi:flagellar basal-body rod protein, putative [Heliomicrobium modesticaldum Ice1]|uniref:Flagellar basal-body rod protein, putative n=1 Tax=Heliobacterium modesticaldum (strain ATCC 51547 / Ice1) TaxID=498761 RepID=B0THM0_HELMI|nr:flagellar hook-basal body protein [Heliomicrobium modesticaldum]ABZ83458.1 flagellar basal-body rod protein, putative [Heliomicrobium modesticaldum Ice1]
MIRGLYTSASGMLVQQTNQDVTANNLANVNTVSFKKDRAVFRGFPEMLIRRMHDFSPAEPGQAEKNPLIGRIGTGAVVDAIWTDPTSAGLRVTQNPTDLAIIGRGYFVVMGPDGEERYTRNGQFSLRADGTLVTTEGFAVQGTAGAIRIPQGGNLRIDSDGRIFSGDTEVAQLRIVGYDETPGQAPPLVKAGDSLYRLNEQGDGGGVRDLAIGEREIRSGALELANVNVVQEMVQMISAARAYEANQKAIQSQDGTLEKACTELGRV